jgi:hypothetical protein
MQYHITQIPPLIQKIPIHIDAVRLGKVFRDQLADRGEVPLLICRVVLNIIEPQRVWRCRSWLGHVCRFEDYTQASDAVVVPSVGMKDERMCGARPALATCLADPWRRSLGVMPSHGKLADIFWLVTDTQTSFTNDNEIPPRRS